LKVLGPKWALEALGHFARFLCRDADGIETAMVASIARSCPEPINLERKTLLWSSLPLSGSFSCRIVAWQKPDPLLRRILSSFHCAAFSHGEPDPLHRKTL
jgi:hypothetical protein